LSSSPANISPLPNAAPVEVPVLSSAGSSIGARYRAGELLVVLSARTVHRAGAEVHLTPTEYKLLATLIRQAGRVVTHRQLLQEVWGANYIGQTHYLRVYMAQLRHKLEHDPTRPRLLLTEPGIGYRLREPEQAA
jgi:two-component system KDP operon response regulator KdpE